MKSVLVEVAKSIRNVAEENNMKTQVNEQNYRLRKENLLLTKQLNDLPKKIVEYIKKVSDTAILGNGEVYNYTITAKNLGTILEKYGDKNESNND